jgi:hypothetical protein
MDEDQGRAKGEINQMEVQIRELERENEYLFQEIRQMAQDKVDMERDIDNIRIKYEQTMELV